MTREHRARTVVHSLLDSIQRTPDRLAFHVIERSAEEFPLTYSAVGEYTARAASGLAACGIDATDRLVVVLPTSRSLLAAYLGSLYAGVVPLLVPEPADAGIEHYAANLQAIAERCGASAVLVATEREPALAPLLKIPVVTPEILHGPSTALESGNARAEAPAHLQATSGSTGSPKLGVIRHRNIVANVHAIETAIAGCSEDTLVSWLPLFHDMGLIGISYALYAQIPMVLADPLNFLRNPMAWPQWISRHHGTLSPAPNAAFHLCARVAAHRPPREDLDLSRWRVALCGAEPVRERTMREFQAAFGPFGLPETTLRPVYGLAESTLAATISDISRPHTVDRVDAEQIAAQGAAVPSTLAEAHTVEVMCVGRALADHDVRVVSPGGELLPDRVIGEIEISGPSVIDGYLTEPDGFGGPADDAPLTNEDGYLRTGDLGYQVDGELFVTGRRKDIVIIAGRNYIPEQIEAFVESVLASPRGHLVVAVGAVDRSLQTEQLHLLLDQRLAPPSERRALATRIGDALAEVFGIRGATIHWIARAELPRTTSGKVQRHLCRKMIEERSV